MNNNKSTCKNKETMYLMEPIEDIPKDKFIKIWNNSCFNIDELVYTIISNGGKNQDPYTIGSSASPDKLFNNLKELQDIINHKGIESEDKRNELKKALKEYIDEYTSDIPLYLESLLNNFETFNEIMKTAHIIMADYTDNFEPSVKAISELSQKINKLSKKDADFFLKFKNNDDWNIQKIFKSINSLNAGCIHGYGYRLASIYITTFNNIKKHLSLKNKSDININSLGLFEHTNEDDVYYFGHPIVQYKQITICLFSPYLRGYDKSYVGRIGLFYENEIDSYLNQDYIEFFKSIILVKNRFYAVSNFNKDKSIKYYNDLINDNELLINAYLPYYLVSYSITKNNISNIKKYIGNIVIKNNNKELSDKNKELSNKNKELSNKNNNKELSHKNNLLKHILNFNYSGNFVKNNNKFINIFNLLNEYCVNYFHERHDINSLVYDLIGKNINNYIDRAFKDEEIPIQIIKSVVSKQINKIYDDIHFFRLVINEHRKIFNKKYNLKNLKYDISDISKLLNNISNKQNSKISKPRKKNSKITKLTKKNKQNNKINNNIKIRNCPPTKPPPPCKNGFIEKQKTYKNGDISKCCYKNQNYKINKPADDKINELVDDKINEPAQDKINEPANYKINEPANDKINKPANDKIYKPIIEVKKKSCKKKGNRCSPYDGPMDDNCEISNKGRCIVKKNKKISKKVKLTKKVKIKENYENDNNNIKKEVENKFEKDVEKDVKNEFEKDVEKEEILSNLRSKCYDMNNVIGGEEFEDLSLDELKNIIYIGKGDKKRCYTLENIYNYIAAMKKMNKTDIRDPIDNSIIDEATQDYIINKMKKYKISLGEELDNITPDRVYIPGISLEFNEVYNSLYKQGWVRITIKRIKDNNELPELLLGYIPQGYNTPDADLTPETIIGTLMELMDNGKILKSNSTIDNLILRDELSLITIPPNLLNQWISIEKERREITKKYENLPELKTKLNDLREKEEVEILDNIIKKWYDIDKNINRYVINMDIIAELMRELTHLKYN